MRVLWILMFVLFAGNAKTEHINNGTGRDTSHTLVFREALEAQQWADHERPCLDDMLRILHHADNFTLWAVWILDSFTQPSGRLYGHTHNLGNYDQCLNPGRGFSMRAEVPRTQYCLVDVTLTASEGLRKPADHVQLPHDVTAEVYLKKSSKHGRLFSKLQWGVCVPESCARAGAAKVARAALRASPLAPLAASAALRAAHCRRAGHDAPRAPMATAFVKYILFLSALTVFCTYYVDKTKTSTPSFVSELARSFCLRRNMATLTEVRADEVHSMYYLRVTSCIAVICIHVSMFHNYLTIDGMEVDQNLEKNGFIWTHPDVAADTFLVLSGLLFTKGILGDKWKNPLKYIWKRYVRLAAALSAILFYMASTMGEASDGPLWHYGVAEQKVCADNWLTNLLMLGNVIHLEKLCNFSTWYVPCDFQLCVFATVLFLIYRKNETLGKYAFFISFALSMIIPGVITYVNHYPPLPFYGIETIGLLFNKKDMVWWNTYVPFYCRAGPFVAGMALGYTMHTYKPRDHRRALGRIQSYLALVLGGLLAWVVFAFGLHHYSVDAPLAGAVYAGVNRALWGAAACALVAAAEYGQLPLLERVFSWRPLALLSKLTYGVYLTHMVMLYHIYFSVRTAVSVNSFNMIITLCGLCLVSLAASLVLWLLVEAPLVNINNMILDSTWKIKSSKSKTTNGVNSNGEKKVL